MNKLTSKYYLVGIKGTGMSSLALMLLDLGYDVIGCDVNNYYFTEDKLIARDIIIEDISKAKVNKDYIYIIGNAYDSTYEIINDIIEQKIEYYYYHDYIGNKLNKEIFAVSGTHGKTTTTNFLVSMLGQKTSYIIGDGTGGGYKDNNILVLEACEYKEHFLSYKPKLLIINNIELDHPDYYKNIKEIIKTFSKLVDQSELVIVNGDDENIKTLKQHNIIRVGVSLDNDIIFDYKYSETGTKIKIKYAGNIYESDIPYKGKHIVYDFVMAYVLCLIIGVTPKTDNITLPKRRMQETKYGNTLLIDDYAHHPTEIKALHEYLSLTYPNVAINVIFQPHTYSRTLKLRKGFVESLSLFDKVYIDKVFTSARESNNLYSQLKINKIFKQFNKFEKSVLEKISKDKKEIWVFLGAGEVSKYIRNVK